MTPNDAQGFERALTTLAAMFDKPMTPELMAMYFGALADLPVEAVLKALGHCSKTCQFMPRPADIREAIPKAPRLPVYEPREWKVECNQCDDTGWILGLECDGTAERQTCGRMSAHRAHSYMLPCGCRTDNRTYQRHHRPKVASEDDAQKGRRTPQAPPGRTVVVI